MSPIEILVIVYLFCLAQSMAMLELDRLLDSLTARLKERPWTSSSSA
jgi:hypothetical protein